MQFDEFVASEPEAEKHSTAQPMSDQDIVNIAMTFLIHEKVSCIIMCNNPLVNEESHCTASFCSVRGCYLNFLVCTHKNGENKTNPKEG